MVGDTPYSIMMPNPIEQPIDYFLEIKMLKKILCFFLIIVVAPFTALAGNISSSGSVKVPDGTIFYQTFGQGNPIILFTGTAATMKDWPPKLIAVLSSHHKVIVFDYPGINNSILTNANFTFKDLANDAMVMMKTLNISSADILGWSMGGWIAQEFTIAYPKKVNHLILVATDPGSNQRIQPKPTINSFFEEMGKAKTEKEQDNLLKRLTALMFPAQEYSKIKPEIDKLYAQGGKITPNIINHQILLAEVWCSAQGGVYQHLNKIIAPTLIINGLSDDIIPSNNGLLLINNISGSSIFRFPYAGHGVMYQYPNKVASLIDLFLA